jgi:RNA polymerase sigma-70 factor (ECF subfamily)
VTAAAAVTVGGVAALEPQALLDDDSRAWLHDLRADGRARDAALARLHALLLKAARFEAARRRATVTQLRPGELDEIAAEAADDALVSILARLDDFRGASRFTTWAYKFALLETAVKFRKRAWQGREIPLDDEGWNGFATGALGPSAATEQKELVEAVQEGIGALTPHQRRVLVALTLNGVPIDVLADRLGTTRGALYKTLHDARRSLRAFVAARGLEVDP